MSPSLQAAQERMTSAKAAFTAAARAVLAGDPEAPQKAAEAFRELSEARALLASIPAKIGGEA